MNKIDGCGYSYPENSRPRVPGNDLGGGVGYWLGRASRFISYYFAHDHYAWSLISASTNMSGVGGQLSTTVRGRLEGVVKELRHGLLRAAKEKKGNQANWQLAASPMEKFSLAKQITRKEIQLDNMIGSLVQGELKLAGSPVLWLDEIKVSVQEIFEQIAEMREGLAAEKAESDNGTQRVLADERRQSAPDEASSHDDALWSHRGGDDEPLTKVEPELLPPSVELVDTLAAWPGSRDGDMQQKLIDKDIRLRKLTAFCKQIKNIYCNSESLGAEDYAVLAKVKEVLDVFPGDGDDKDLKAKLQSWHTASLAGVAAKIEALKLRADTALARAPDMESPDAPVSDPDAADAHRGVMPADTASIVAELNAIPRTLSGPKGDAVRLTLTTLKLQSLRNVADNLARKAKLELENAFATAETVDATNDVIIDALDWLDSNPPFGKIAIAIKEGKALVAAMRADADGFAEGRRLFDEVVKKLERYPVELRERHVELVGRLLKSTVRPLLSTDIGKPDSKAMMAIAANLENVVTVYKALPEATVEQKGLFSVACKGAYDVFNRGLAIQKKRARTEAIFVDLKAVRGLLLRSIPEKGLRPDGVKDTHKIEKRLLGLLDDYSASARTRIIPLPPGATEFFKELGYVPKKGVFKKPREQSGSALQKKGRSAASEPPSVIRQPLDADAATEASRETSRIELETLIKKIEAGLAVVEKAWKQSKAKVLTLTQVEFLNAASVVLEELGRDELPQQTKESLSAIQERISTLRTGNKTAPH